MHTAGLCLVASTRIHAAHNYTANASVTCLCLFTPATLDLSCRFPEREIFIFILTCHVGKPTALLSLSNVNKGRRKISKCKELKMKSNFMTSKIITKMVIKNAFLGIEPWPPAT